MLCKKRDDSYWWRNLRFREIHFRHVWFLGVISFYVLHNLSPDYKARARNFLPLLLLLLFFYFFDLHAIEENNKLKLKVLKITQK